MKIKQTLQAIVFGGALVSGLVGCEDKKPEAEGETEISGVIINEAFTEGTKVTGIFDKVVSRDPYWDRYEMVVRADDGRNFAYSSMSENARSMDILYNKDSRVKLPIGSYSLVANGEYLGAHDGVSVTELSREIIDNQKDKPTK